MVLPKVIELRPDRDLLDVNFGGYKLSLEPIPSYQRDIECGVDHVPPSEDQYSFLHLKVFSLHNHLYGDPWSSEDVYFIDKRWRIQKNKSNPQTGCLEGVMEMWEIPASSPRKPGHYNPSLSFPDSQTALVADGTGILHVINTGLRSENQKWTSSYYEEVLGTSQSFVLVDSRSVKSESEQRIELHCLLMWVDEIAKEEKTEDKCSSQSRGSSFQTELAWIVLVPGEGELWTKVHSYQLSSRGELFYSALEVDGCALYVASEDIVKFTHDSLKEIDIQSIEPLKPTSEQGEDVEKKQYMWQQTVEDIEIRFNLAKDVQKEEISVDVKDKSVSITCRKTILLAGSTWGVTDPSLSCWSLEQNRLLVTLSKAESGLMWQHLIPSDKRGEEVLDPSLVEEIHQRLAHLCSDQEVTDNTHTPAFNSEQLEECDTGNTNIVLVRLDPSNHSISHQASLGGHQALFTTRLSATSVPALCLRHDVDGCMWQPLPSPKPDLSVWPIDHVGTFHAFGYVQASKQQKKFSICAPDLSYVAICDATRHIYLYRQPRDVDGSLRNRRTGQKVSQTAQQQLISLPDSVEVLGAFAGNHFLFVLTDCYLIAFNVNPIND